MSPLTYPVGDGPRELPFRVVVLSDLVGERRAHDLPPLRKRKIVQIERRNFCDVLKHFAPRIQTQAPLGARTIDVDLELHALTDFEPAQIVARVRELSLLLESRDTLAKALDRTPEDPRYSPAALSEDVIVRVGRELAALEDEWTSLPESAARRTNEVLSTLVAVLDPDEETTRRGSRRIIRRLVRAIDAVLSPAIDAVLHASAWAALEATWRGIRRVVDCVPESAKRKVSINLLCVSKRELVKNFQTCGDIEQSVLWKRLYRDELTVPGGQPFDLVVADFEFTHEPEDVALLTEISRVAAEAHVLFVSSVGPELMDVDCWADLPRRRDLARVFERVEYGAWSALRNSEESRWIGLCLPRVLLRRPCRGEIVRLGTLEYEERWDPRKATDSLWGNAALEFARCAVTSFLEDGRFARIGRPSRFRQAGTVAALSASTTLENRAIGPTDAAISIRRAVELERVGLIAWCVDPRSDSLVAARVPSFHRRARFPSQEEQRREDARLSLDRHFVVARLAHFLGIIVRDVVSPDTTTMESRLRAWLAQWASVDVGPESSLPGRFLRSFEVRVNEVPARPNVYAIKALLDPLPSLGLSSQPLEIRCLIPAVTG